MEYFTECPHCQNKFKVLIQNIQGEIYSTNCPKCSFQFTFRIPVQQIQYQQQLQHQIPQTQNQQFQNLQTQPQIPSQSPQTSSQQFQNLQSKSQKQNQIPQIPIQQSQYLQNQSQTPYQIHQTQIPQFQHSQSQMPNVPTPQIPPSQFSYFQMPMQFFKKPSNYNVVGVLLIISALLGYLMAGMFASLPLLSPEESNNSDFFEEGAYICGLSTTIFSSFALIGGVVAFTGKHHGTIIVGSVYGVLAIGFFIGAILSVIALILFYRIKKENESFDF